MIRIIGSAISVCLSVLLPAAVVARTLSVSAGKIASGVMVEPEDTELSLVGNVNAADLHHIALNCRSLRSLDLSGVDIVAYSGEAVATNRGSFPADELPAYSLSGLTAISLTLPQSLHSIGDGALMSASVENIVIPESVDKIGVGSFADCGKLRKVRIASTVKSVGAYSFKGCGSLTDVDYDSSTVPESAFSDCAKLSKISFGNEVKFIGKDAFAGCISLSDVTFAGQASLSEISDGAFAVTAFQDMDFGDCQSLKSVGAHAFAGCAGLESIVLPSSVEMIGEGIFLDCGSLKSLILPERVSTLPAMALKGASSMSDLSGVLGGHVSVVGELAMAGMGAVEELPLPASLREIGSNAFEGCTSLGIILAEKLGMVPALGSDVWLGLDCPSIELVVDEDMASGFSSADQWKDFKIKIFDESAIDSPVADRTDAIRACLHESVIEVGSSQPIVDVRIYDLDGRRIFYAEPQGVCNYSASVTAVTGKVYIVSVSMSDGSVAAVKLLNSAD